ncbi:MFS transporter [Vibrio sp. SCSIO 43140]|uniref:MFS transporter n=1 Tax=Vibrio sp. SCSIO 43140 TaxID=2819100 RepID=UPI00207572D3|nr:MFS transporter [Vibrio sp. SCSIO 43140]USD62943.1 MFS transporter [Vibrio sp. SCSIO 43140]
MLKFLICSFALVLLYPTAIDLYLVGLPQISADLSATESQLHIAFSIYLAGMATTMLLAGKLSDSLGRKPMAIAGATIFVGASLMGGAAEQVSTFLAARFAQGIGAGSCYVVAFAILRDTLDDKRRAKVLSMINGITCIVPVIAPVVGHLIMLKFPWQSLFTTMAGMGVLVCLLSLLLLKETKPTGEISKSTSGSSSQSHHERFLSRFFVSRVIIASLSCTVILTYVNVSPMLMMGTLELDRGGYSTVMAMTALVSMITSFSAPLALTFFRERTLIITSQSLFAIAAATLVLVSTYDVNAVGYFISFGLICAAFSIGFGVTMSQALSPYSRRAGVASSILGVSQVCTSAFYIWLLGILGVSALYVLIAILALTSIVCLALISWTPKSTSSPQYEESHNST